jgi:cathepsin H
VDCAGAFDNAGCDGGLPSHAFEYIKYAGGLTTEAQYPYMAKDQSCKYQANMKSVGVEGGSVNISLSEGDLKVALFKNGPISVAFKVMDDFEDYESGIYSNSTCPNGPMDVNHAVVAVGYGTERGMDYWIIKNSWSTKWGEDGFFRMQRGVNMCGIINCNSYPQDVLDLTSSSFPQSLIQ